MDAEFETMNLPPEELTDLIEQLRSKEIAGAVMATPHKTPSIPYLDKVEDAVEVINSVNLIMHEGEGSDGKASDGDTSDGAKLVGYNTDRLGSLGALRTVMPKVKDVKVLVLGAGGAARAAAYELSRAGAEVSIWNRTPERAKKFAEKIGIEWVQDMRKWEGRPEVLINATAASHQPKQSSLVPYQLWENAKVAMDAVYGKTSLFLEEAHAAHVPHQLTGEIWFLHQVIPMFKMLTGQDAPIELIEDLINESSEIRTA